MASKRSAKQAFDLETATPAQIRRHFEKLRAEVTRDDNAAHFFCLQMAHYKNIHSTQDVLAEARALTADGKMAPSTLEYLDMVLMAANAFPVEVNALDLFSYDHAPRGRVPRQSRGPESVMSVF
jgi:hypothetical protein